MHTTQSNTQYKNESKHSEMGTVRQNPIRELLVCSYVCASHCAQLLHTILHRTDLIDFPPYPPDNHHYSDDVYLREGGLLEQEMMGWQWHQLDQMQISCTSLQKDNHVSTSSLSFELPAAQPTVSKR